MLHFFQTLIAMLMIAATPAAADETAPDASLRNPLGPLVELARQNMMNAVEAANKRISYCLDLGKSTVVNPAVITTLKLTLTEIKIALFYLHSKADDACMSGAINAATVDIIKFKVLEREAFGQNDPKQYTAEEVCCGTPRIDVNAQLNYYMRLSADKRAALEAIPEFKKSFNVFKLSEYFDPPPVSAKPERTAR